jgi:Raf kinase inhibitor-like YbhB/YbcL family protein
MIAGMRWGRLVLMAVAVAVSAATAACGGGGESGTPKPTTARFEAEASSQPGGLKVTSSAFADGKAIPEGFSCRGSNAPPPVSWSGVPSGTGSVALVVTDPDAPSRVFVHWVVVGLPGAGAGSLPGGSAALPAGARVETNSAGHAAYTGMCPPGGQTHTYVFEVLALRQAVSFAAGASPLDKVQQLRAAATRSGKLTGTFG